MPIVRYLKEGKEVEVPVGASILQASQEGGLPEGYACGGVCACSTCHVYVKKGGELLSEMEDDENDILDKAFDVRSTSRLGCQARIEKDGVVEVEITRESYDAYYNEHPEERPKEGAAGQDKPDAAPVRDGATTGG
jgi:ferredoxin, 2Fe-2S